MNKQEAIEYFKNKEKGYLIKPSQINVSTTEVIHILNQIDEPEKPVIPQFVADWIENCKIKYYPMTHALSISYGKTAKWLAIDGNDIVFAMAYGYGYTVEKPKLYTVEIPNNGSVIVLAYINHAIKLVDGNQHLPGKFTKKSIEFAGFGWVFDCIDAKVVEVE